MTLEAVYYVSQIAAVVAIFGSLVFVGLQLRAQTLETRYGIMNQILADYHQLVLQMIAEPPTAKDYFAGFQGGLDAVSPDCRASQLLILTSALRVYERAFIQHEAGRVSGEAWDSIQLTFSATLAGKAMQEYWQVRKVYFSSGFAKFVEIQLVQAQHDSLVSLLETAGGEQEIPPPTIRNPQT